MASTSARATTVTVLSAKFAVALDTPHCCNKVASTLPVQCGHIMDGTLKMTVRSVKHLHVVIVVFPTL